MEEFTVENFHFVICRHIRGPKEQFNYGSGRKDEREKEESRRKRRRELNWKISSSGRHQRKRPYCFMICLLSSSLTLISVEIFTFSYHAVVYLLTNVINCH